MISFERRRRVDKIIIFRRTGFIRRNKIERRYYIRRKIMDKPSYYDFSNKIMQNPISLSSDEREIVSDLLEDAIDISIKNNQNKTDRFFKMVILLETLRFMNNKPELERI